MKRRWLQDWPWETVVTINAGLCKEKNALHKPTSDGYKPAHKLWETSRVRELTLRETFDICRQCHKARAVLFLQWQYLRGDWADDDPGFAAENATGESAQLSQRGYYIAGTAGAAELAKVLDETD